MEQWRNGEAKKPFLPCSTASLLLFNSLTFIIGFSGSLPYHFHISCEAPATGVGDESQEGRKGIGEVLKQPQSKFREKWRNGIMEKPLLPLFHFSISTFSTLQLLIHRSDPYLTMTSISSHNTHICQIRHSHISPFNRRPLISCSVNHHRISKVQTGIML